MFKIIATTIDGNSIATRVEFTMRDGSTLEATVPVAYVPDITEQAVIDAIKTREEREWARADSAPVLESIKAELDKRVGVPQLTAFVADVIAPEEEPTEKP